MTYATYQDVQARMSRELSETEIAMCTTLLEDAALIIDAFNKNASYEAKLIVSCRMVIRSLGDGETDIPIGATQGSMSGLGYSQSWTVSNGSVGEMYLSKLEKQMLGLGNKIGSRSPLEEVGYERHDSSVSG